MFDSHSLDALVTWAAPEGTLAHKQPWGVELCLGRVPGGFCCCDEPGRVYNLISILQVSRKQRPSLIFCCVCVLLVRGWGGPDIYCCCSSVTLC